MHDREREHPDKEIAHRTRDGIRDKYDDAGGLKPWPCTQDRDAHGPSGSATVVRENAGGDSDDRGHGEPDAHRRCTSRCGRVAHADPYETFYRPGHGLHDDERSVDVRANAPGAGCRSHIAHNT